MSRIDDDRQAQMVAEKLALQKRQEEDRAKETRQKSAVFSQLVTSQTQTKTEGQKRQSVLKAAFEQVEAKTRNDKKQATEPEQRTAAAAHRASDLQAGLGENRTRAREQASSQDSKRANAQGADGERSALGRAADQAASGVATAGRANDQVSVELGAQGRENDQQQGREGLFKKAESALKGGGAGAASPFDDELKSDADRGNSGSQGGSGGDGKKDGDVPQSFRLNPALMAPVAVAQPKTIPGSDKLRALANEIAQKIVERVRVGQNSAGKAEFQIDLKSTVLRGLSIKVSGGNGRISAVFSGSDRDVMKMLREQEGSLRKALSGRGLALTEFKIEDRA
jgi:hypothetical protein